MNTWLNKEILMDDFRQACRFTINEITIVNMMDNRLPGRNCLRHSWQIEDSSGLLQIGWYADRIEIVRFYFTYKIRTIPLAGIGARPKSAIVFDITAEDYAEMETYIANAYNRFYKIA